jgi:HAD superfamily hydrolase (TIGR01509 family)
MAAVKAVIFDMDGVIIDSRELIYRAMEDTLATNGVHGITRQEIAAVTGKPIHAMYALLAPNHDAYELEKAHLAHHQVNMHLVKVYDGASAVLAQLKLQGRQLGLFTGFDKQTYDRLRQFELEGCFGSVVECTRYTKHKPDPEGLYICLEELAVAPEDAVYIGDGVSDVLAGKAAGVRAVIGITQGFGSREALEAAGADYIIDSLSELPTIIKTIEQKTASIS